MTIEELKTEKRRAEAAMAASIQAILADFQEKTAMGVGAVDVQLMDVTMISGPCRFVVDCVSLEFEW